MEFFIDSSVFLNLFLNEEHSEEAEDILSNVELGADIGYATPHILEEITFKLIVAKGLEIIGKASIWRLRDKLRKDTAFRREILGILNIFFDYVQELEKGGLRTVPVLDDDFKASYRIIEEYGLLPSDALTVAVMRRKNIKTIATFDKDFKTVKSIKTIP
ncbi:MAG: PIN domain-containing protein [Candidatus Njordarchaeia archaeon]